MNDIFDYKTYKLDIEEYIKHLTGGNKDVIFSFLNGNCYQFALILKDVYNGEICVNTDTWHHLFLYKDNYYDATGMVDVTNNIVKMSEIFNSSYADWFLLMICQRNKWTLNLDNNFDAIVNYILKETNIEEVGSGDAIKILKNYLNNIYKKVATDE